LYISLIGEVTDGEKTLGGHMKVLRNKETGQIRVLGNYGVTSYFQDKESAMKDYKRIKRNSLNRFRNEILRDITGTSARAAREDMGL
jgi:hypothetical protein